MANVNGDSGRRTERVNIPWIIGSWSIGALLIAGAFYTEHFYRWRGVSIDTMVSVGSAFLLADVLFFLQRRFLVEVEEAVERAATSAADARIDERVQEVDARLDELGERMNEVLAERKTRQDRAVQGQALGAACGRPWPLVATLESGSSRQSNRVCTIMCIRQERRRAPRRHPRPRRSTAHSPHCAEARRARAERPPKPGSARGAETSDREGWPIRRWRR